MAQPYLGEIKIFAGNFAPRNYAMCNGQLLAISQNTALFSLLGTQYGGNGTTTFALPNLQGRAPMHQGQGPGLSQVVVGEQAGVTSVTLLSTEIPSHNHTFGCGSGTKSENNTPANEVLADQKAGTINTFNTASDGTQMNAFSPPNAALPHENRQPSLALCFIIATAGIFPARN